MIVPITDVVKMTRSVADISVEPIIGTPLVYCSTCVQYAKPWPYFDIRSCCRQSVRVFTSRYDSTLLGHAFFTPKVFLE